MPITFHTYDPAPLYTSAYARVRDFLIRINRDRLVTPNFTWGRWEWMIGHSALDQSQLGKIGLWQDGDMIVALSTYESGLGDAYFCADPAYAHLKEEMLRYAMEALRKPDGAFRALIADGDREFQRIAHRLSLRATQDREHIAALDLDANLHYALPVGFSIASMADGWSFDQYHRCMWRGFNHGDEPPETDEAIALRRQMLSGPWVDPSLVVAVVASGGEYAAHCGMWCRPGDLYAYVEPVCTPPEYRRLGLGKAAVLEACRRAAALGAKQALVGSSQQFYYRIGFAPVHTETWWA